MLVKRLPVAELVTAELVTEHQAPHSAAQSVCASLSDNTTLNSQTFLELKADLVPVFVIVIESKFLII